MIHWIIIYAHYSREGTIQKPFSKLILVNSFIYIYTSYISASFRQILVKSNFYQSNLIAKLHYFKVTTLECEINVPAGINMPAGKNYENNKHASWKI